MNKKIITFAMAIYISFILLYILFEDTLSSILFGEKYTLNEIITSTFVGAFVMVLLSILISHYLSVKTSKVENRLLKTLDEKDFQYEAIYQDHEFLKTKYTSLLSSLCENEEIKEEFQKGNIKKTEEFLLKQIEKDKLNEIKRYITLGDICFLDFQYTKAINYYQESLNGEKDMLTDYLKEKIYNLISKCYFYNGLYNKAIDFEKKSLSLKLRKDPFNYEGIIQSYINIAINNNFIGSYKESVGYYKESLKLFSEHLIDNKELQSSVYNNLGLVFYELEHYENAVKYYLKALALRETMNDSELDKATSYNCIGASLNCLERYEEANNYLNKALAIRIKLLGEMHLEVSIIYNNLGLLYMNINDNEKAKECFEKTLVIKKEKLRNDHPSLATIYNNISQLYCKQKEFKLSIKYLEEALNIVIKNFGEVHIKVVYTYSNIGMTYFYAGDYDTSLKYHKLTLKKAKQVFNKKDKRLEMFKDAITMTKKFKMMKLINECYK